MSDGTGLIKRFYKEIIEGGNLALIDELSTDDFVDHEEALSRAAARQGGRSVLRECDPVGVPGY